MAHEPHAREGSRARGGEAALAVGAAALVLALHALAQPPTLELDTPFVTTPANVVSAMLDLAGVRAGDRLIDLGSGDGRIVIAAAKRGARALGVEIDRALVERSREAARREGVADRATFVAQDLFETDVSDANVVTLYLLPDVNARLAPKFLATLRPGTRIVSHDYGLGDWPPDRTLVVDAPDKPVDVEKKSRVHFWRVPARFEGRWSAENVRVEVEFRQAYQVVSGTLRWDGREYRFEDARIDGTTLAFRAEGRDRPAIDVSLVASEDRVIGTIVEPRRRPPMHVLLRRS